MIEKKKNKVVLSGHMKEFQKRLAHKKKKQKKQKKLYKTHWLEATAGEG